MRQLALNPKQIFVSAVAAISALTVLAFSSTAFAVGEGQVSGGDIYRVRNVTTNSAFTDPVSAKKCETLQYKVRLHNPGVGAINNVVVKATIPAAASTTNVSTMTITAQNAFPATMSDTATVNLNESLKISYVPGSSQLLDANGGVIRSIGDVTAGSGVNIGTIDVSTDEQRYVQFQAKVDCPSTPPPPCVDNPNTPEDECNPVTPPVTPPTTTTTTTETPTGSKGVSELLETGPNSVVAIAAVLASIAGYFGYSRFLARQLDS